MLTPEKVNLRLREFAAEVELAKHSFNPPGKPAIIVTGPHGVWVNGKYIEYEPGGPHTLSALGLHMNGKLYN